MKAQTLYIKATDKMMNEILEYYKCHFTIKETAKHFGFSYTQIYTVFYKFKIQQLQKYDRTLLANLEVLNDIHSAAA